MIDTNILPFIELYDLLCSNIYLSKQEYDLIINFKVEPVNLHGNQNYYNYLTLSDGTLRLLDYDMVGRGNRACDLAH